MGQVGHRASLPRFDSAAWHFIGANRTLLSLMSHDVPLDERICVFPLLLVIGLVLQVMAAQKAAATLNYHGANSAGGFMFVSFLLVGASFWMLRRLTSPAPAATLRP